MEYNTSNLPCYMYIIAENDKVGKDVIKQLKELGIHMNHVKTRPDAYVMRPDKSKTKGTDARQVPDLLTTLMNCDIKVTFESKKFRQIGVFEFVQIEDKKSDFQTRFKNYLKQYGKGMEVQDIIHCENPDDAVILLQVGNEEDYVRFVNGNHIIGHRSFTVVDFGHKAEGIRCSNRSQSEERSDGAQGGNTWEEGSSCPGFTESGSSSSTGSLRAHDGRNNGGSDGENEMEITRNNEKDRYSSNQSEDSKRNRYASDSSRNRPTVSESRVEMIDLQSVERLQLVKRLLDIGYLEFDRRSIKYDCDDSNKTVLIIKGENSAVHELVKAIRSNFLSVQVHTVEISFQEYGKIAQDFVQILLSDKERTTKYIEEFLHDNDKPAVVILLYGNRRDSLAVSSFVSDEAKKIADVFEQHLLRAQISTMLLNEKGKAKLKDLIKQNEEEETYAVAKFLEREKRVEIFGAPTDVILLVGQVEKLVSENETQGYR